MLLPLHRVGWQARGVLWEGNVQVKVVGFDRVDWRVENEALEMEVPYTLNIVFSILDLASNALYME
jgi:hypothetical protein